MDPMYLTDVDSHRGTGARADAIEQMRVAGVPVPQIMHLFACKPSALGYETSGHRIATAGYVMGKQPPG